MIAKIFMEKFTSHRYYFLKNTPTPKNLQAIEVAPNNHKYISLTIRHYKTNQTTLTFSWSKFPGKKFMENCRPHFKGCGVGVTGEGVYGGRVYGGRAYGGRA